MMDAIRTVMDPANANARMHLATFSIPGGNLVVILGPLSFWIQMGMMLAVQAAVSSLCAVIVYEFIVKRRGSTSSYLVGFGFVIPVGIMVPFWFITSFGIMNIAVMIGASALTVIVPFNCIEAMFDTSERGVESSLQRYIGYYCSIIPFVRHTKTGEPIPITKQELYTKGVQLLVNALILVTYASVMMHFDFVLCPSPRERNALLPTSVLELFHWGHLINNLAVACFTCQCLATGTQGVGLAISIISGCKVIDMMKNPIFGSQSPSDFWGRRWNLMVHGSFKRGVFKPLTNKLRVSRFVAMLATFAVSGILHEHVCTVIGMKYLLFPKLASPYAPNYGRQFTFFLWNGFVVLLEYVLAPLPLFQWMKSNLLKEAISLLVLLTVIPISHWFTDEYIRSGFYSDYTMGFPLVQYLTKN